MLLGRERPVRSSPGNAVCQVGPAHHADRRRRDGKVRFEEIVEGETLRKERDDATGAERWVIMEHKGDLHPQIIIEDDTRPDR